MSNLSIYAWRDNLLGGFIGVSTEDTREHRKCILGFNKDEVHFNAASSHTTSDYMKQITAIAQIATMAASSKEFRERCMKDVSVIKEVPTVVPVKIL